MQKTLQFQVLLPENLRKTHICLSFLINQPNTFGSFGCCNRFQNPRFVCIQLFFSTCHYVSGMSERKRIFFAIPKDLAMISTAVNCRFFSSKQFQFQRPASWRSSVSGRIDHTSNSHEHRLNLFHLKLIQMIHMISSTTALEFLRQKKNKTIFISAWNVSSASTFVRKSHFDA